MRYIHGPNLATVIGDGGPQDRRRVCELLAGGCRGARQRPSRGIDPSGCQTANVLLTSSIPPSRSQLAYLCDFGIARHTASSSSLTTAGQFLGTLQYCSPANPGPTRRRPGRSARARLRGLPLSDRASSVLRGRALGCYVLEPCSTGAARRYSYLTCRRGYARLLHYCIVGLDHRRCQCTGR
jgi:serine/threonine protein kinase